MKRIAGLAGAAAVVVIACGGNVVIDNPGAGSGGSGAASPGTTTGTGGGNGGGATACPLPLPVGLVQSCSASATVGAGMVSQCVENFCDAQNHTYESNCSGNACSCSIDGKEACVCAIQANVDICSGGSMRSCCPFPFPH